MGRPVEVKRVLADFRVNLTVPADDYSDAVQAGAIFDEVNGVLFVPPRVDLLPVSAWLPFSLDSHMRSVLKVSDDYGIIAFNPAITKAAGRTKMDGSPNMSFSENIRVAKMLMALRLFGAHPETKIQEAWFSKLDEFAPAGFATVASPALPTYLLDRNEPVSSPADASSSSSEVGSSEDNTALP